MRYTKYQYKKKNNGIGFLTSVVMTVFAAGIIGLVIAKVIFSFIPVKDDGSISTGIESPEKPATVGQGEEVFSFVQCGMFSNQDNANKALSDVGNDYDSFILEDDSKFRVSAGIFNLEQGNKISEELTKKGVTNAQMKFVLNKEDEIENQISAITSGYLDIVNALNDKEVKSVKTTDFKNWANELPEISKGDNLESLNDFKKHISELPDELKKENVIQELKYIYTILVKYKK